MAEAFFPQLTPEQLAVLDECGGDATFVDPKTAETYAVMKIEPNELDEQTRQKLDEAWQDVDAGRFSSETTEDILLKARRLRQSKGAG